MLARLHARLTYANAMSTIAVFVALGGSAYAVTGEEIDDGTITSADIQGSFADSQNPYVEGTITTEDIRNGFIFPVDIAPDTLGPAQIAAESLGGGEIANDSLDGFDVQNLTGADVVNDSLDGFDVQNLTGADVIDGSIGPEDLAAGVRGFSRVLTRHRTTRLDRGERTSLSATCPAGWVAISGGYDHSASRDPDDFAVSYDSRFGTNGWLVSGRHVGGPGARDISLRVSVNCVQ